MTEYVKTVTADTAAQAMGSFSLPMVDPGQMPEDTRFWTATHSWGGRTIKAEMDSQPVEIPDEGLDGSWLGYEPKKVISAHYTSFTSGSGLRYTRTAPGRGTLEFIPSETDPGYKGSYFGAWESAAEASTLVYTTSTPAR